MRGGRRWLPALALAGALTACGGGVSKAEFVTAADGACATGNGAISAVAKPGNAPGIAAASEPAATTIDTQVGSLKALKLPDDGRGEAEGVIAAIAEVSGPTRALQEAAGKNDEAAMAKAATEMQAKADAAANRSGAYGLAQCGTGLKPALANLFDGTRSVLKTSFLAKGEALCRESLRRSDALPQPGSSLASLSRFIDRYLPIYTQFVADFKALVPPPGDEATVQEIVAELDAAFPKISNIVAAAKANNTRLVGALFQELDVDGTRLDAKLDAYGLKACGSAGGF